MDDDELRQFTEEYLPRYRDELIRNGMSKEDAAWACSALWTGSEQPRIQTVKDYMSACNAYEALAKDVPRGDWRSPGAIYLHALGGAMIEFEQEYEKEHGRLPPTS